MSLIKSIRKSNPVYQKVSNPRVSKLQQAATLVNFYILYNLYSNSGCYVYRWLWILHLWTAMQDTIIVVTLCQRVGRT